MVCDKIDHILECVLKTTNAISIDEITDYKLRAVIMANTALGQMIAKDPRANNNLIGALDAAEKISDIRQKSTILRQIAVSLATSQRLDQNYETKIFDIIKTIQHPIDKIRALMEVASVKQSLGHNEEAQKILSVVMENLKDIEGRPDEAWLIMEAGTYWRLLNNKDMAKKLFLRALHLERNLTDPLGRILILSEASRRLSLLGDQSQAEESLNKATALLSLIESDGEKILAENTIALAYAAYGKTSISIDFLTKAFQEIKGISEPAFRARLFSNIALVQWRMGDVVEATKTMAAVKRDLNLISNESDRVWAEQDIYDGWATSAVELSMENRFLEAADMTDMIEDPIKKSWTERRIAIFMTQAGDQKGGQQILFKSLMSASHIANKWDHQKAFSEIIPTALELGITQ
ncbi:MAG: hypothetical protein K1X44_00890 [Alphaproteobacteria bacterium]|nr:hypothetical protein [Alphaproteobacteria bacterium]